MIRTDLQRALQNQNVAAFLKAIRLGEGTQDDAGYCRIVGGRTFTDDSIHPNQRVFIERYNVYSTAAGAYQIIHPTWEMLRRQYDFQDFSAASQDEAAVALIAGRHALNDVIAGDFSTAVKKCSTEWASLPGSKAGQRIEAFDDVLAVYLAAGGTVADAA